MTPYNGRSCANCKIYNTATKTCQIMVPYLAGKIEPTDYCTQHISTCYNCANCGMGILSPIFVQVSPENYVPYCENCYRLIR
jgi:hypothetical protein